MFSCRLWRQVDQHFFDKVHAGDSRLEDFSEIVFSMVVPPPQVGQERQEVQASRELKMIRHRCMVADICYLLRIIRTHGTEVWEKNMTVCHKPSIVQNKSEDYTQAGTCVGRCCLHYAML